MEKALKKLFKDRNGLSVDEVLEFIEMHSNFIYKEGLSEEAISLFIDYFVSAESSLTHYQRKLILQSLVPNEIISEGNIEKLLFWLCSNMISNTPAATFLMTWLQHLVQFGLICQTPLENMYGFLLKNLRIKELAKPLCKLLLEITTPKLVTKSNVFLVTEFYNGDIKEVGPLLKLYHSHCPSLVSIKPRGVVSLNSKEHTMSVFEECIKQISQKIGLRTTKSKDTFSTKPLPLPEYDLTINDKNNGFKKISSISGMYDLGRKFKSIRLPDNLISLLSMKEGMMYLVLNGPNKEFLASLSSHLQNDPSENLLKSIAHLQEQLMNGLPEVTKYLSDLFITWDGYYHQQIIYTLIPWLHFDTFHDLEKLILIPLSRVYVSSDAKVKVQIIDAFTFLIINIISVHIPRHIKGFFSPGLDNAQWLTDPLDTVISICRVMNIFLNVGVCLEGTDCTLLINKALNFNHKIVDLQLEFAFTFISVIPPIVVYGALFSYNHETVSQLCSLINKYKEHLIPTLAAIEVSNQFKSEIECIESYAVNIFSYLWRGEEGENIKSQLEFSAWDSETAVKTTIGKKHLGIYPFITHVARSKNIIAENLSRYDLLDIYRQYARGISEFLEYELSHQ